MKKILVTGCKGQMGIAINKLYINCPEYNIINTDVNDLNITMELDTISKIKEINPNFIINCAAYTAVDSCEDDEDNAYLINAIGPKNLSLAANETNAVLIHISSDYVFSGEADKPYVEGDGYNPKSVYGKTKLQGEEFVRSIANKYFILRTAWLYGDGNNFVNTMLRLAGKNNVVKVVNDQFGTPTSSEEVAKVIDILCKSEQYGTYHATCEGYCSWAEFAETIYKLCDLSTVVIPVTTEEFGSKANRPAYSVLYNKKLNDIFDYKMADWHTALEKFLDDKKYLIKEGTCL